jgi:uncharacterized protein YndB with AHSA1/START domain
MKSQRPGFSLRCLSDCDAAKPSLTDIWYAAARAAKPVAAETPTRTGQAMTNDRTYAYVIYIAATPEQLWQALTDPAIQQQYWPEWRFETDWRKGSKLNYHFTETGKLYSTGEIVESIPSQKLSYTWPEEDGKGPELSELLTWEIYSSGPGSSKLTLTHSRLTDQWYEGVSRGWPPIVSNIKTILETGKPLPLELPKQAAS